MLYGQNISLMHIQRHTDGEVTVECIGDGWTKIVGVVAVVYINRIVKSLPDNIGRNLYKWSVLNLHLLNLAPRRKNPILIFQQV